MATKKQRKRSQKERRHEYETVWVDPEGNELEEPPDDAAPPARDKKAPQKRPKQSQPRATRTPLPPSWRRSVKRSLILGAVVFAMFALLVRSKNGQHQYASALAFAVFYTALFVPFTYYVDRFSYRRSQRKAAEQSKKR